MHVLNRPVFGALALALLTLPTSATAQLQAPNGVVTLAAGTGAPIAALRESDTLVNQLTRDGSLRLTAQTDDPLAPDRSHERLQQFHEGVPVYGAEVTRQTARGLPVSLFGTVHLAIDLETTPELSADDAAAVVRGLSGRTLFRSEPPQLVVLPDRTNPGTYRLVYEARTFTGSQLMV
jgi:Zn-dependent metalloprotease